MNPELPVFNHMFGVNKIFGEMLLEIVGLNLIAFDFVDLMPVTSHLWHLHQYSPKAESVIAQHGRHIGIQGWSSFVRRRFYQKRRENTQDLLH